MKNQDLHLPEADENTNTERDSCHHNKDDEDCSEKKLTVEGPCNVAASHNSAPLEAL